MKLHENPQLFEDAINFASRSVIQGGLGPDSLKMWMWLSRMHGL